VEVQILVARALRVARAVAAGCGVLSRTVRTLLELDKIGQPAVALPPSNSRKWRTGPPRTTMGRGEFNGEPQ